ncbi:hypothetical protein CDL15_Pgr019195 [Punica granatum]|uniref:Rhamnogalacturonan lyase domain-containing protein n=1 Tax=Punica granatum TaxID=22663 RepID=A0A218W4A4_PUNGR|nr:hypothetical protein CDL15_Pgr019195 [Punica granatum]
METHGSLPANKEAGAKANHDCNVSLSDDSSHRVLLHVRDKHVVMDNGILQVTISKPEGTVSEVRYNGISNLLETRNDEGNRGIKGTSFNIIVENEEQAEISFTRIYDSSQEGKMVPLNIDIRFIMLRNCSGFYSYGIYEHLREWPAFNFPQTRIVFKLKKDKFHYMAVADNRQRYMPLPDDRSPRRGKPLAFPEAVLLVNPVEPEFKGEVDDKYQYSCENKDLQVHGWICSEPPIGFWQITPSNEFRTGGLLKQNLTSHVGPITLAMFLSAHYGGEDLVTKLGPEEPWKKVFGPVFFYLNCLPSGADPLKLWEDAKQQMAAEVQSWPYNFPASEDFQPMDSRGFISGRLLVRDSFGTLKSGCQVDVANIVYEPMRDGPTLWEIGFPDRTALKFYVPDPDPKYINKLYVNHPDKYRQYGLWERYAELYPEHDLVYTIGVSDHKKDWFFAQVNRKVDESTYKGTTWQIKFKLEDVNPQGTYMLRLALATANNAQLEVRVNEREASPALFSTGVIGKDNAIARHGIHGLYRLFSVQVPANLLIPGENTIFLSQTMATGPLQGVMYDYIRLEGPPPPLPPSKKN